MIQFELFDNIETFDSETNLKGVRDYNWGLVSYASIEELQPLLNFATYYAYILHDKDLCKNNHYHILLYFKREISWKQLNDFIDCYVASNQNTFKKPIKNKKGAFDYLTHKNNTDKYQYNESDIISNKISHFSMIKEEKNIIELIDDIINGLSYRELIKKWGRDFVINEEKYRNCAYRLKNLEKNSK